METFQSWHYLLDATVINIDSPMDDVPAVQAQLCDLPYASNGWYVSRYEGRKGASTTWAPKDCRCLFNTIYQGISWVLIPQHPGHRALRNLRLEWAGRGCIVTRETSEIYILNWSKCSLYNMKLPIQQFCKKWAFSPNMLIIEQVCNGLHQRLINFLVCIRFSAA